MKHKIEKLPLVDGEGRLKGLITSADIVKKLMYPNATRDSRGRLMVAAAVGVREDAVDRAEALLAAGADALVIDVAHGPHRDGYPKTCGKSGNPSETT
jgi:IMP dehydrogenase